MFIRWTPIVCVTLPFRSSRLPQAQISLAMCFQDDTMPDSKFIAYQPNTSSYASRHADEEWEQHYTLLHTMHTQSCPRWQMRQALEARGFEVSSGQLTRKMKEWKLMVTANRQPPLEAAQTISSTSMEDNSFMVEQCTMTTRTQHARQVERQRSDASEALPTCSSIAEALHFTLPSP